MATSKLDSSSWGLFLFSTYYVLSEPNSTEFPLILAQEFSVVQVHFHPSTCSITLINIAPIFLQTTRLSAGIQEKHTPNNSVLQKWIFLANFFV